MNGREQGLTDRDQENGVSGLANFEVEMQIAIS
jgi:hypothetical protein